MWLIISGDRKNPNDGRYWCTVNRTFHRANPSTLKHFIRQFFSFPIVSYGVWDSESYKKNEYLFIFVPYLSVLKVREWIYVDVEWIYVDVDRPRYTENFHTRVSTAKFYKGIRVFGNFPQTVGMLGLVENCETMQKMHLVVCGNPCMKVYFFSR